jgi:CRP-like cAMP-binding protein
MLLEELSADECMVLAQIAGPEGVLEVGSCAITEGEPGDSLFIVQSGRLQVEKEIGENSTKRLQELGPGDFFGEMSFLNKAPRSASVRALTMCSLLEVNAEKFERLIAENAPLGVKFMRGMARELTWRLRATNEELKKSIRWAIEGWTLT